MVPNLLFFRSLAFVLISVSILRLKIRNAHFESISNRKILASNINRKYSGRCLARFLWKYSINF